MTLSKQLLEILACPRCKGELEVRGDSLVCAPCELTYPVRDGIPVLLVDEAEHLSQKPAPQKAKKKNPEEDL